MLLTPHLLRSAKPTDSPLNIYQEVAPLHSPMDLWRVKQKCPVHI
ncbi:unnamed protein product [Acanthoscelides obtectus]|uniref:Uncharacterized protein n=1 Tax=Acanthoscelides obtectus TaxID=200917 RepID=A0A9P0P387_ACAOB|nr:unnamed protein product [Acanthoscelides obtectus]CAK1667420.1 hypothetical protein AOBTE_LOCUS25826 [Acanthoscelides obtectus]